MKKIYRVSDPDKKKIAGICAGLGEMFSMDPTIVRLILIFACVLTGFFPLIITYAAGWFIIPEKSYRDTEQDIVA